MFESMQRRVARASQSARVRRLVESCRALLSGRGEAAGVAQAKSTLALWQDLDAKEQRRFFHALLAEFSPDPAQVLAAAHAYAADASAPNLAALVTAAEPPRQELLRRLNRAPGGTRAILRMREALLAAVRDDRPLEAVDWDFRHLLASWFNPGFLEVVRLDWRTPAYVLEQVIAHEAVHEIRGWNDLRRRLELDRRCFAFFHPALPHEPLIFVEVALMDRMPEAVQPLLDLQATTSDPSRASVAAFYSINNCQPGLRGVSLGNFLIKGVVDMLSREFPRLRTFCTLSPIPAFAAWLRATVNAGEARWPASCADALRAVAPLAARDGRSPAESDSVEQLAPFQAPLMALCATYLLQRTAQDDRVADPVERFHLHNGARLERLNWLADTSRKGLRESLGMMVNYLYDPGDIEANHEKFARGETVASRRVRSLALR
jgi:malonyl-CoA decarboxylase